jgi:hypothetical protein
MRNHPRGGRERDLKPIFESAFGIVLALALALLPLEARADGTSDEADLQFRLGVRDTQRNDYEGALEHFLASNRLAPNRNVMFNIATAYEQLHFDSEAYRYYVDALENEIDPAEISAINIALERLKPRIAVLDVTTQPSGATLYIGRKDLGSRGRTPRSFALPPGHYHLIAELVGHEPKEIDVDAVKGEQRKVSLALSRIVGTIHVEAQAGTANAPVVVHGDEEHNSPSCQTPCDLQLAPGKHDLSFAAEGFQTEQQSVVVIANQKTSTSASLQPLVGSLLIRADETGALVTVDGVAAGFTPAVIQGVAVGRRKVRVSLRGFAPVEFDVEVQPSQQVAPEEVQLIPLREVSAASRRLESVEDAPSSVSVISSEELRAFGYPTIAEALRGVRGVTLSDDRAYTSANIRGLGQPEDYGNRLLVLSDGQSLNSNIDNSSALGNNARVDLHDVDHIEVVRGPGSLLYGTGAFSGVVDVTSRPHDEPTGVEFGFGSYDDAVVHGRAAGHLNLGDERGGWVSASAARSGGFDLAIPVVQADGSTQNQTANSVEAFNSANTSGRVWWVRSRRSGSTTSESKWCRSAPTGRRSTTRTPSSTTRAPWPRFATSRT